MVTDPLTESGRVVIGSNGRGVVTIGPMRSFEKWIIKSVAVQNSGTVLVPTAKVYRGAESASAFVSGSASGNLDTDSEFNVTLQSGEQLVVVWEGADVGSNSVVTVQGERTR